VDLVALPASQTRVKGREKQALGTRWHMSLSFISFFFNAHVNRADSILMSRLCGGGGAFL